LDKQKGDVEVYLTEKGSIFRSKNKFHGEELGFSQVNTRQNKKIQDYLKEKIGPPQSGGSLLDLYCGQGNFSFPLNDMGWSIYGIDCSRPGISAAQARAQTQGQSQAVFKVADVSIELRNLADKKKYFEAILLDPPRIGADERVWKNLAKLNPETLIYISCNPATFARDWARLKSLSPYKLVSIQPFDMFPQTFHVELVAIAKK